ncbi:MAG: S-layer homology domain-containing protein, partial [Eubacteriales bacterium]
LWAVENGITMGTSDTTFSPDADCTRAQIVTFLWRAQKSPAAGTVNPFTDVTADAYYADAVLWAVENGITMGTSDTTFSPDADCTRAQIVTFIWRTLAE